MVWDLNLFLALSQQSKLTGIVSDLFPRMVEEAVDYGALELAIRKSCIVLGLEDVNGTVLVSQFRVKPLVINYPCLQPTGISDK